MACKVKHNIPPFPISPPEAEPKGLSLVNVYQFGPFVDGDTVEQFFQSVSCMHCADAPCIKVCPRSAIYKDMDKGITLVDEAKCIGCQFCQWVCPYGATRFDESGKLKLCDMCLDRLEEGKKPACEAACPAGAIITGTPDAIEAYQAHSNRASVR